MKFNWGNGILIFIILFLILSSIFIIFSFQHANDLVTDDYYNQGAAYSKQIEINKRSAIYSDSLQITNTNEKIEIQVNKGLLNITDSFQIYFFRPSDKSKDYKIGVLKNERIIVPKSRLMKGRYIIKLSWKSKKEIYLIEKEIFVN